MNRKGQGLSLTTIVVAAIALLVLVILSVVFIGRMGGFAGEIGECTNKGGHCRLAAEYPATGGCPAGETKYASWTPSCVADETYGTGYVCCIAVS